MEETRTVRYFTKTAVWDKEDPVFRLQDSVFAGQEPPKAKRQNCEVCNTVHECKPCTFCSAKACEVCRRAKRPYPQQVELPEPLEGRICSLCERKYMMYSY